MRSSPGVPSRSSQGDTDSQTMSGAIATGTKGSGPAFGSLSSMLRPARIVNGIGDVIDIGEHDLNLLHAAQVSIGLLGVMTRLEVEVVPRYRLAEQNCVMSYTELADAWDDLLSGYRHFSFWWCPFPGSSAMYDLGDVPPDHCVVKLLREAGPDEPTVSEPAGARLDRSHLIYPDGTTEPKLHELEYMVPATCARDAVELMRRLQLHRFTEEISPVQIRWQKGDQGYLSPEYQRDSVSVSVSGVIGKDYEPFLRAVDHELQVFDARPHWGKIHYLTPDRVRALYPRFDDFQAVHRKFDPAGLFLNDHLRGLFAD